MNGIVLKTMLAACLSGIAAAAEKAPLGMALIPAGNYSPLFGGIDDPQVVNVPAFFLDVQPVTNADFLHFVMENPKWRRSAISPIFAEAGYLGNWSGDLSFGPNAPADAPVVQVSWFAARAYARWRGLRLPTTAEWERAASAGFSTGDGSTEASYREAALKWLSVPSPLQLPPAGSGRPDIYGVRDLTDLVWEWVNDFNAVRSAGDSGRDASLVCGAAGAGVRDFTNYPAFARSEYRSSLGAVYAVPSLGFRCARSL
jgi:formylglycine-generating enzyme